jgi:Uma2 family endonuclease
MPAVAYKPDPHLSHSEYFELERREDWRYEYLAGDVYAMAGGSESHALIAANSLAYLAPVLRQHSCRVYGADMKLRIEALDKFCYPDLSVHCEPGRRHPSFLEGPSLVVEVLSRSTESYDRGLKFEHYRAIPELRYYLLLDQERPHAELFEREADGAWRLSEYGGMEAAIPFDAWGIQLPLSEVYRDVEFGAEPAVV